MELPADLSEEKADNRILKVCKGLLDQNSDSQEIVLVTKDLILRLKAQILGIKAEDFITEQILDADDKHRYEDERMLEDKIEEIFERGIIRTEALNFIRGRSISKAYLIIDEAQNMTPNQIDKPFLDEKTNGLSYAAKHMKNSPLCWQLTLFASECERSELAMDAIKRLCF